MKRKAFVHCGQASPSWLSSVKVQGEKGQCLLLHLGCGLKLFKTLLLDAILPVELVRFQFGGIKCFQYSQSRNALFTLFNPLSFSFLQLFLDLRLHSLISCTCVSLIGIWPNKSTVSQNYYCSLQCASIIANCRRRCDASRSKQSRHVACMTCDCSCANAGILASSCKQQSK